ncbi:DUF6455 family protein [Hyphomicrobium sp.]|uniref:DUF6455 family protein n=1 Tax=Hyphomicrobium sp. TaxID=82 RepID=UPI002FE0F7B2
MERLPDRHLEQRATRMAQLMERLNVDTLEFVRQDKGQACADARVTCLHCSCVQECLQWMRDGSVGEEPAFCPNLALFESCRRN